MIQRSLQYSTRENNHSFLGGIFGDFTKVPLTNISN